jgi:hypothetical protein
MKSLTNTLLSSLFFSLALGACQPEEVPPPVEICGDTLDNDGNGLVDCEDIESCQQEFECQEQCDDNLDNDQDGFADCSDDECAIAQECLCSETTVILSNQLPIAFEADSADGVELGIIANCQDGPALEFPFNLSFPDAPRIDVLVEPLSGEQMVLMATTDCDSGLDSRESCANFGDFERFDTTNGQNLFLVGSPNAGKTGRFRITFSLPE